MPVVAHRNSQDEHRHNLRCRQRPGSVVPATRVPVVSLVGPEEAIVEEEVPVQSRSVVDGRARHHDELRERRQVDPDVDARETDPDAHLSSSRSHRAQQRQQHNERVAHILSSRLVFP